jgi:hypothetical protein
VQHPFTGVSTVDLDIDGVVDACRAYEPLLRASEAFSHTTAALLWGAPLPRNMADVLPLHVLSPTSTRARTDNAQGHRAAARFPVAFRFGLPVVTAEGMWLQLAPLLRREDLVAVGDHLVSGSPRDRRNGSNPPSTLAALAEAVGGHPHARGILNARWALPQIRVGVDSRPETLVRLLLVEAGLPEPAIAPAVAVAGGRIVLHPDLAYPDLRIAIEYEGERHRDTGRWEQDIERHELFEDAGWRVIRVTRQALFREPDALVERVRRARIGRSAR